MAVRFGVIFITDNYTIDRRVDRVDFKKLLASVSQISQ